VTQYVHYSKLNLQFFARFVLVIHGFNYVASLSLATDVVLKDCPHPRTPMTWFNIPLDTV